MLDTTIKISTKIIELISNWKKGKKINDIFIKELEQEAIKFADTMELERDKLKIAKDKSDVEIEKLKLEIEQIKASRPVLIDEYNAIDISNIAFLKRINKVESMIFFKKALGGRIDWEHIDNKIAQKILNKLK